MVRTYEIDLAKEDFQPLTEGQPYVIVEDKGFNVGDYILFRELLKVKPSELKLPGDAGSLDIPKENPTDPEIEATMESGLYSMTIIDHIIRSEGLKPGYVLLVILRVQKIF